jgi:nucleotide-binding universal stress UspA family protein
MTMFKNVLVGVDGRAGGRDAIALASRLVDPAGKLTLVHVHSGELGTLRTVTLGLQDEEHEASVTLLERERAAADVTAELVNLASTGPGPGLHQQAERQNADLLVVGSCSHGAFGRAMLGDDTRAALNGASCAVAVASLGYAEHAAPIDHVGVGYDGSPESKAALEMARALAAMVSAKVQALEVVSMPTYAFAGMMPPALGPSIEAMLSEASSRMSELSGVEGRAVYGITGEELAVFGDEVDILIVGSRGYGPARRLVLGSTSDYLERHARCSLLVLPRVSAETADPLQSFGKLQAEARAVVTA